MTTLHTKLVSKKDVAAETLLLRLDKPADFTFEPGQTIDLSLPSLEPLDAKGNMRVFSIVSAPYEPFIEVATRIRESAYKLALKGVPIGTEFELEGPFGSFALHDSAERPAVMLVGGIGITPFRSMILDTVAQKRGHQIFLFYSNRRSEDAAFLEELMIVGNANKNITVVPTMTEARNLSEPWDGETGYITFDLLKKYKATENKPIFYMAGPQTMVLAMKDMLTKEGISKDDIRFEEFPGY